ncbi:hypothetical protein CONLIGDRAFT_678461 [Coniochaeta ligniaria NRRL 30616]|uniref:Uncharacterized protein n=1 Tax=Coniochaeta ligniaria NRRL 30616 TaxID=1408157 RepID=A0A1J7IXJ2_9PEZI|nr:hypothetical protein CONLIGDRAFT_678461 [Coniochaeta ligniaria NRRL 30616]
MDGISSLALSAFETVQTFKDPASGYRYDAVEVTVFPEDAKVESGATMDRPSEVTQHQLPESRLLPWFQDAHYTTASPTPEATFRAIRMDRNLDVSLNISKACFVQLFDAMRADPAVKYMICHDYDGFHEFSDKGYLTTRFIGTPIYAILWTYLILQWSDRETSDFELGVVRHVETRTGFGPQPSGMRGLSAAGMEGKFNINVLTSWSQAVNEVSGNIGNKIRHQKISGTVLGMITEASKLRHNEGVPDGMVEKHRHSLEELARAVPSLERHLNTYLDYLAYLKDRAERLSAVLFALLTHEDAGASINIATASKRDSSSMKTVAVMTMAFLPATFFAALFAVPSLRWDQARVMQDNFWVYWAFTLPATAIVFLVWYLITQQNWILGFIRKMVKEIPWLPEGSAPRK